MNQSRIDEIAGALAVAWREGGSVPLVAEERRPTDLREAWQIQDALDERLDHELVGWKIGGTSRATMQSLGVSHPRSSGACTATSRGRVRPASGSRTFETPP